MRNAASFFRIFDRNVNVASGEIKGRIERGSRVKKKETYRETSNGRPTAPGNHKSENTE
jgi:hypothetical protein